MVLSVPPVNLQLQEKVLESRGCSSLPRRSNLTYLSQRGLAPWSLGLKADFSCMLRGGRGVLKNNNWTWQQIASGNVFDHPRIQLVSDGCC